MADWSTADEWFAVFLNGLAASTKRRRQLHRERVVIPAHVVVERAFQEKTEQLRRYLAGQTEEAA